MAKPDVVETLDSLFKRQPTSALFARIVEIFEDSLSASPMGSEEVITDVAIPGQIDKSELSRGMAISLGEHQGQYTLLQFFEQWDEDADYLGLGYPIPSPPFLHVFATEKGWLVEWPMVVVNRIPADRYHLYKNDTQDDVSPVDLGYIRGTLKSGEGSVFSVLVPYESPYVYFSATAIIAQNESVNSAWVTDALPPPVPDTFFALGHREGHNLTILPTDVSLKDRSFKCWEIEDATDGAGSDNVSLGYFFPDDMPYLRLIASGTLRYYRIRSVDWAGNESAWTDPWDPALSGETEVQDDFSQYGDYWYQVSSFDDEDFDASDGEGLAPGWLGYGIWQSEPGVDDAQHPRTGRYAVKRKGLPASSPEYLLPETDFSGWASGDFILFYTYTDGTSAPYAFSKYFYSAGGYKGALGWGSVEYNGVAEHYKNKSDLSGPGDWAAITAFRLVKGAGGSLTVYSYIDDLRFVAADPDDASTYNDTYDSWDKAVQTGSDDGIWHVYEGERYGEPPKPFIYGQTMWKTTPSLWYLSLKPITDIDIITGAMQAGVYLKDTDGAAGIAFMIKDATADSWDMYAIELDTAANTLTLAKWVAGARTQIDQQAFTATTGHFTWIAVDFQDYVSDGGRLKVYASLNEGNVIREENLVIDVQDTEWVNDPGGSVGLLSYQTNARFACVAAGTLIYARIAAIEMMTRGIQTTVLEDTPQGEEEEEEEPVGERGDKLWLNETYR